MLKRMNRGYTRAQYDKLVDAAREMVPDVVLASDFIAGFPGETEEDHQASIGLIHRSGFKNSFIFKYSPRPGTLAADRYEDDVPDSVKRRRNYELLSAQKETGLAHHRAYIGRMMEVLVTGPSRKEEKKAALKGKLTVSGRKESIAREAIQLQGRTRGDHIVVFEGPESLADTYVNIRIDDANDLTLFGSILEST
jgi:tRNA-2-methylthio-N6-dimethylallyladenosine synthase